MNIKEYREYPAFHYSELAALSKSPSFLIDGYKEETTSMKLGSALDCLITDPSLFEDRYRISEFNGSDTIKEILISISKKLKDNKDTSYNYDEEVIKSCKEFNYGQSYKEKTLLAKFQPYKEYLKDLLSDYIFLTSEEMANIREAKLTLFTHDFTKFFFNCDVDEEIFYQFPIIFTVNGIKCKVLFDLIKVDHKNKVIYPADIKTSDSIYTFPQNFLKFRYDIQASLYTESLYNADIKKLLHLKNNNYRIEDFRFIVISLKNPDKPLKYNAKKYINFGKYGWSYFNIKMEGWMELIDDYKWYKENELYDYRRDIYENNGEIEISIK